MGKNTAVNASYDEMIVQVEQIIDRLQANDKQPLDKMVEDVEKAVKLLNECRTQLTTTTEKLDALFGKCENE